MGKKKRCALCGKDLTHRNFKQIVKDGVIVKVCPGRCEGVNDNEKATADFNRMLRRDISRER